jgi:type II secretory pathway component PulF
LKDGGKKMLQSEINDLISSAFTSGIWVGLLVGISIMVIFSWLLLNSKMRSFKMWLHEIPYEQRVYINHKLLQIHESVEDIASKSNTKFFKSMYNDLCALKYFLSKKWLQ